MQQRDREKTRRREQMTTFFSGNQFSTTYFNKLPDELIFHIRSFNFDWAAKIIQKKTKECFQKKIEVLTELVNFSLDSLPREEMAKFSVFYKNKILKPKDILDTFSKCNCCERHQINKPKELKKWVETTFHGTQDTNCSCHCRHFSRFICRACD